jgi:hypothetical protein
MTIAKKTSTTPFTLDNIHLRLESSIAIIIIVNFTLNVRSRLQETQLTRTGTTQI